MRTHIDIARDVINAAIKAVPSIDPTIRVSLASGGRKVVIRPAE